MTVMEVFWLVKKMIALLLAVGSLGVAAAAPMTILHMIPAVECTTPLPMTYEKRIHTAGTIEAKNIKEIYLETPVIAEAVNVSVGDFVREDQVLAVIDTNLTKSVLEQSIPAAALMEQLPIDQQVGDLMGLYAAFQSSSLIDGMGSLDDLSEVYAAIGESPVPANPYVYVPETVTAPMNGIVTEVGIQSNVLSRSAKPVVTISDTSSFVAMVTVGEAYVSDIHLGDRAIIKGTGFTGKIYSGYVNKIYPVARKTAGTNAQETVVDMELIIDNPDADLKAGFTVQAEILTNRQKDMLTIPYEAVQQDENNIEYVYVVEQSKTVRRDIVTGMELVDGVEVIAGLNGNDVIISDAAKAGTEGSRINLQRGN